VGDVASPAVGYDVVGLLELQNGVFRHWTVLAIDIERRIRTENIQRGLKPLYPDRIKHRRGGCGRRKSLINAWKFLFADLSQ
jgi:hypothetical protein